MNFNEIKSLFEQLDKTMLCSVILFLLLYCFAPNVAVEVFELIHENFLPGIIVIASVSIIRLFLKLLFKHLEHKKN